MSASKFIKWSPSKTYPSGYYPPQVEVIEDMAVLDTRPKKGSVKGDWLGTDFAPKEIEVDVFAEGIPIHGSPRVQVIVNGEPSKPFLFYQGEGVCSGVSLKLKAVKGLSTEDPWIFPMNEGEEIYRKEFINQEKLPSITYHRTLTGPGQWVLEVMEQQLKSEDLPLWGYGCVPYPGLGLDQWQQSWGYLGADIKKTSLTVLDSNQLRDLRVFPSSQRVSGGQLSPGDVVFMDSYDLTQITSLKGALMSGMSLLKVKSTVEMPPGFEEITYRSRAVQELDPNINQLRITYELQRRAQ